MGAALAGAVSVLALSAPVGVLNHGLAAGDEQPDDPWARSLPAEGGRNLGFPADAAGYRPAVSNDTSAASVSQQLTSVSAGEKQACPGGGAGPEATPVEISSVPITVDSTTADYFVLYVLHERDGEMLDQPVSVTLGEDGTSTLAENVAALPAERYRVEKYLSSEPADVDGDCTDDLTELASPSTMSPVNPAPAIEFTDGAVIAPDRGTLATLAGSPGIDSSVGFDLKFTMYDLDTDRPSLYFINRDTYENHRDFVAEVDYKRDTAVDGGLKYVPELASPDGNLGSYVFTIEHWSIDAEHLFGVVARSYALLAASMPFIDNNLMFYIPNHQVLPFQSSLPMLRESRIDIVFDSDVFPETRFLSLNSGEGYGRLQVMDPDDRPHPRDIVIYEALPNELPRVGGIVTTVPQTPLSHVNLRAVQDNVPNAYILDVLDDADVAALIGGWVHYTVTETGWSLTAATPEAVDAHYASLRPTVPQIPQRNLSITSITPLSEVGFDDWDAFGVKAANVAVLGTLGFPEGTVPDGFAVPFYFYDEFMKANGLYDRIDTMLADPDFQPTTTPKTTCSTSCATQSRTPRRRSASLQRSPRCTRRSLRAPRFATAPAPTTRTCPSSTARGSMTPRPSIPTRP